MDDQRGGRGILRPSFHLYLLVSTLTIFFAQIPLGVFAAQSPLDSTAHVLLPAAATSLLYDALYFQVMHSPVQYFCTMALLGVSSEMIWEVLEFGGDAAFGLTWQVDNADTMQDILYGIAGAVLGAGIRLWIWLWTRRTAPHPRALHRKLYYRRSRLARHLRGRFTSTRQVTLVGTAVVLALAPPGYVGYLASAMPAVPPGPAVAAAREAAIPAPGPSIAVAALAPSAPSTSGPDHEPGTDHRDGDDADPVAVAPAGTRVAAVAPSVPIPSIGTPVPVGPTPGFVAVAPNGRQAYVANRGAGVVTVVDTAVDQVTATIPVPPGPPQYLTFSPDGRTVYISIWDEARTIAAIGVLDTTTNSVVATIPVRTRPFLAAITPDGRQLYVPNHDSGTVSVVDTATRTVTDEIRVAADPHWVEFSRDGRRAYTADHESDLISVIDTATHTVVAAVPAQHSPHSVAVHPTRPLVADVNYDSDTVTMADTDSDRVVATVPVGHGPQDITWAPDGRFAYVANVDADTVSVIDATTMTVTATIPTGNAPTSVAVLPNGRQAYVTNLRDGTLSVLYTAG
jgi:YVTN family beta-propeller protein